jgi:hypothetical protein
MENKCCGEDMEVSDIDYKDGYYIIIYKCNKCGNTETVIEQK